MIVGLIVFDWRVERYSDAMAMPPNLLCQIYEDRRAFGAWIEKVKK